MLIAEARSRDGSRALLGTHQVKSTIFLKLFSYLRPSYDPHPRLFVRFDSMSASTHLTSACYSKLPPCQTHQFWLEDPWSRPPCEWGNARCPHPHPDPTGPSEPELLRANIALQTENSQLARVRGYVGDVLGGGGAASDVGIGRSGTSR